MGGLSEEQTVWKIEELSNNIDILVEKSKKLSPPDTLNEINNVYLEGTGKFKIVSAKFKESFKNKDVTLIKGVTSGIDEGGQLLLKTADLVERVK